MGERGDFKHVLHSVQLSLVKPQTVSSLLCRSQITPGDFDCALPFLSCFWSTGHWGQGGVRGLWAPGSFQPELDGACNQDRQKLCDETEDDCSGKKKSAKSPASWALQVCTKLSASQIPHQPGVPQGQGLVRCNLTVLILPHVLRYKIRHRKHQQGKSSSLI